MTMTFERLLPRLVTAYHQGLLVPFLGAGMSRESCPDWTSFIEGLEREATRLWPAGASLTASSAGASGGDLIVRANAAIRSLALGTPMALQEAIHTSIYRSDTDRLLAGESTEGAPQSDALASIWWPLIVTSNYDDLFFTSYARHRHSELRESLSHGEAADVETALGDDPLHGGHIQVLGRSRRDCAHVLTALSVTVPTVLWAIHGFLPRKPIAELAHLAGEMVVGHDEYRRVAHADPYYRRAFGELWRRRSLLFVGSGLGDPYLLDLFSEVQELHGTNPQPHYALVENDKNVDEELLRTRFNIIVARYGTYQELPTRLHQLAHALRAPRPRPTRFAWNYNWDNERALHGSAPDIEIVHGGLPTRLVDDEGLLVGAGFPDAASSADRLFFSAGISRVVMAVEPAFHRAVNTRTAVPCHDGVFSIASQGRARVAAIRPWKDATTRDLALLRKLLRAAFDWAHRNDLSHLHMPLIGAGASRHFPAAVPLSIIARAHRDWCVQQRQLLRLTVHVLEASAVFELTSGRFQAAELLTTDDLRFWVEIDEPADAPGAHDRFLREPFIAEETDTLASLASSLGLPSPATWEMRAEPAVDRSGQWIPVSETTVLAETGLSVGATLRVRRSAG